MPPVTRGDPAQEGSWGLGAEADGHLATDGQGSQLGLARAGQTQDMGQLPRAVAGGDNGEGALAPAQVERMNRDPVTRPCGGSPWKNEQEPVQGDGLAYLFHFSLKRKAT